MAGGDSGSNSNSSRSNSPTKKKNESRLGKSPLTSAKEKKQSSSSAGSSTETDSKKEKKDSASSSSSKMPKPRVYKAPRPPTPHQSGNETTNNNNIIKDGKETSAAAADDKKNKTTLNSNSSSSGSRTEESSGDSIGSSSFSSMSGPKITVISFSKAPPSGRSSRAPASSPPPTTSTTALLFKASTPKSQRADSPKPFQLTVETIMTSAKPLVFSVVKSQTIGAVKKAIKGKTKVRHFGIYLNNKELLPEDSTLESHGIVSDTKVRLHVKAQTGTTDKEDINSLIKLTKSINDLKTIINALPSSSSSKKVVKRRRERKPKAAAHDPQKKEEEDARSRHSMAKLREKFAQRRGGHGQEKKKEEKKKKKKTRKEGGIAGQYALPPTKHPKEGEDVVAAEGSTMDSASDQSNRSAEELSDRDKIKTNVSGAIISIFEPSLDLGQCPVTNKELLLYFDVPETEDRAKFLATELFEPPNSLGKLEELRKEFKVSRCAHCRSKLPLILREMPCRCGKVFCQPHRSPFKHCCAVDLKKVDRIKLEKEVPKSNPVSRKNSDEEIQPKSFNKKFH